MKNNNTITKTQRIFNFGKTPKVFAEFPPLQKAAYSDKHKSKTAIFEFAGMRLVCDECAAPLHLYGVNFFDTYTSGTANILRCLCDICAAEFWGGVK